MEKIKRIWPETDINTFSPEAMVEVTKILGTDPRAVMLNGYYCGRLYEDTTGDDIAQWIHGALRQRQLYCWNANSSYNINYISKNIMG